MPGKYRITGVTIARGIFPAMDAPENNYQCLNSDFLFTSYINRLFLFLLWLIGLVMMETKTRWKRNDDVHFQCRQVKTNLAKRQCWSAKT